MMLAAGERTDGPRTERPRFRQDLFAEVVEEQGTRFIDVMDPDSGNLFRFYEVEYSLACGMDGERDVAGIVKWAQDELGLSPSAHEVQRVIATLGDLGFIASGEAAQPSVELGTPGAPAAPPVATPPTVEVSLGAAGTSKPAAPPVASPPAPDVGLGAPGATAAPRKPAEPAAPDVGLGAPGRQPARPTPVPMAEDVSLSLSDHVEVRPDDVKEAVRQSRIMPAVELPKDLEEPAPLSRPPVSRPMEAAKPAEPAAPAMSSRSPEPVVRDRRHEAETVEAPPLVRDEMLAQAQRSRPMQAVVPEPEPVAKAPEPVKTPEPVVAKAPEPVAKAPEPVAKAPEAVAKAPEAKPTQPVAKPPVELPKPPVVAEKQPVVPPAPRSGTSPALIILLVLVVLGVGGFLVWKYVLQNDASGPSADNTPAAAPVKPAEPPPPPPAPAGKVALVAPAPDDLKVAKAGSIENILDATHVAAGDVVIRLVGDRPIEAQLDTLRKDLGKLKDQLEAATKKRDAAAPATQAAADADVAARQKALDAKQAQISTKQSELDAFVITAPANGAFTPNGKAGQKVGASDVVGKLQRDALPSVTFKVADPKAFTASAPVTVVANHQPVSCTVADVAADSIKVACPADPMLTDGADVTLAVPAAGSAAPANTEPPATGSGSGSDSAAPPTVGSAEAGAGSSK